MSMDPYSAEKLARLYQADRLCDTCRARLASKGEHYRHRRVRTQGRKVIRSLLRRSVPESAVCPGCGAVRG